MEDRSANRSRAIHDAQERRHVVRQLGAAAVSGRIDVAEVVLEADPGDDGDDGRHDAREDRAIIVATDHTRPGMPVDRGTSLVFASAGR